MAAGVDPKFPFCTTSTGHMTQLTNHAGHRAFSIDVLCFFGVLFLTQYYSLSYAYIYTMYYMTVYATGRMQEYECE